MTDEYQSSGSQTPLTAEQRREMSLVNLAQSRDAGSERHRHRQQKLAEKKLTEAEKHILEQNRILEERELRRALSEENRREAFRAAEELPVLYDAAAEETDADSINISIDPVPPEPEAPAPKQQEQRKSKPRKSKEKEPKDAQQYSASAHSVSARGYTASGTSSLSPNRITAGGAILFGLLTSALIGLVIYGKVQTNEAYTEIAALQAEYDDLVAQNISMKSEMDSKMTVKNIEEYAEDVLGLMPLDQSQIEYIQLQTEDEVTVTQPEESFFVILNDYLVRFWEFLGGS